MTLHEPSIDHRKLPVPPAADGMRLDRFLALRFTRYTRTVIKRAIQRGEVRREGVPLKGSYRVREGELLQIYIEGLAPSEPAPPFPDVLFEDDRVIVIQKPPGLICHPAGDKFSWAIVSLAKAQWPNHRVDLVHRLDRETSGAMVLTKDVDANRFMKAALKAGEGRKEYLALCKATPDWTTRTIKDPIGSAGGPIRIQMGVQPDGLSAHTDATVLERRQRPDGSPLSLVHCRIYTGRTHQIRVHLHHHGAPLLGDKMYGVPPDVFLRYIEQDETEHILPSTGAPRHALHAARIRMPHPDGHELDVRAPLPPDMQRWWDEATPIEP